MASQTVIRRIEHWKTASLASRNFRAASTNLTLQVLQLREEMYGVFCRSR